MGPALYGGVERPQPAAHDENRGSFRRTILATALGFGSALLPWPEADDSAPEIELLAPRGRVSAAPTRICWRTSRPTPRVRLRLLGDDGSIVTARTESLEAGRRALELTPAERDRVTALRGATIEILALSDDGELLGWSEPARFTLPPPVEPEGW